jgi:gliding motility-associated-like protein
MKLHLLLVTALLCIFTTSTVYGQLDCCQAAPFAGGALSIANVNGPGAENDSYAGTCLASGEHDAYFLVFEALSSGTFEMMLTPNGLNADYDFALLQGGCPGNAGTSVVSCSYVGPITAPGPFVPTGISSDPLGSFGVNPNAEIVPTVNLVAGNLYVLILDNITTNGVGFSLQTAGSAQIGPPSGSSAPPVIDPAGPFCAGDPPAFLTANPPGGTWSGPFTQPFGQFDPAQPGTYTVTYTAAGGLCPTDATTQITVLPAPVVQINPAPPLCEDSPPFILTANPPGGIWGGAASPTGQIDPTTLGPGTFQVTYTVTGPNGCVGMGDALITINPLPQPDIIIPGPFCLNNGPVQLTANPPGGTFGNSVPPSGFFDPVALGPGTFAVTYTYTDPNGCTNTVFEDFTIVPGPIVSIVPAGPFCEDDPPQQLIGDPPGGFWGGDVDASGLIVPQIEGPGPLFVTYTFVDANGCQGMAEEIVEILPLPLVQIDPPTEPICSGGDPVQLTAFPSGGVWTGNASSSGIFDPSNLAPGTYPVNYQYTDPNGCANSTTIDITVELGTPPVITDPGEFCTDAPLVTLEAFPTGGTWIGEEVAGGVFDPQLEGPGTYQAVYSFSAAGGCGGNDTILLTVNPLPTVTIDPAGPFCESNAPTLLTATPTGGTWSGDVPPDGSFDPSALGEGNYTAIYTFTDALGCTNSDTATIEVVQSLDPTIATAGPFCADGGTQQLSASPAGGTWSGDVNPNGSFEPTVLGAGTFEAIYTSGGGSGCDGSDTLSFVIVPEPIASIDPAGPFCISDGIQSLTGNPAGGTWGGAAAADGSIDPVALGTGTYQVSYIVSDTNSCSDTAFANIEILEAPSLSISGIGALCQGATDTVFLDLTVSGTAPFTVVYAIDGTDQPTIITSDTTFTIPATVPGTYTAVSVEDANGCVESGMGSAEVVENGSPMVSNIQTTCNPTNTEYVVSFEITGGDPASYTVSGNGSLSSMPPYTFTSGPIPNGTAYDFQVDDANSCNPTSVSGNFSCDCITSAGSMDTNPTVACEDEIANLIFNNDATLDPNDTLVFVLHDNNGTSLGNILATNDAPSFGYTPNLSFGTTYYVSAVAADAVADTVDYNSVCLSVSLGAPLTFYPLPTASLSGDTTICEGGTATLTLNFTGTAPFEVVYNDGQSDLTLSNLGNEHSFTVDPMSNTTYQLISVTDSSPAACSNSANGSVSVQIAPIAMASQVQEICQGDTLFLAGDFQTEPGQYIDTLVAANGCDSILTTDLIVNLPDTTLLSDASCDPAQAGTFEELLINENGCDSLVITTVDLLLSDTTLVELGSCDPADVGTEETLLSNVNGCDSLVITTTVFLESDTTILNETSCDPAAAGTTENLLTNANGCDSLVITTTTLLPSDTTFVSEESCNPLDTGTVENLLVNQFGCDSLVVTTTSLLPSDTTFISQESCNPLDTGTVETLLPNQFGCDSLVVTTTNLLPSDTTFISQESCNPLDTGTVESLLVNQFGCDSLVVTTTTLLPSDTTFVSEESCNPLDTGTVESLLINQFGCDSLVVTTTSLLPSDTTFISAESCNPQDVGTEETLLVNQFGCDSLVVVTTSLLPSDTTFISTESCDPQDVGTEETLLVNQFGCDSLVITTTSLLPSDTTLLSATSCDPAEVGTTEELLANQFGCDSLVITTTTFVESDTTTINLQTCDPDQAGTVSELFTNQNGCDSVVFTVTTLVPFEISIEAVADYGGFGVSCPGATDGMATAVVLSDVFTSPISYQWSNGEQTDEANSLSSGWQFVTVTSSEGCTAVDSVLITEPDSLQIGFTVSPISCFSNTDGQITVNVSGGVTPFLYSINEQPYQSSSVFNSLTAGEYLIGVQDANGCESSESILISEPQEVSVDLGDDISIQIGEDAVLSAMANIPIEEIDTVIWEPPFDTECPTCLDQIVTPLVTTAYMVEIIDVNGCSASDEVRVFVDRRQEVFFPTAFSPNGDENNDIFRPFTSDRVELIEAFQVYNRWGEPVFEVYNFDPNNDEIGWDGTFRGEEMNPAVFVFTATIRFRNGTVTEYKGDVTLMR